MKHHFKEKVINMGYLEGIQTDIESRLQAYRGKFAFDETPEERAETMENHVKGLIAAKNWIEDFWTDYMTLYKKEHERLQNESI